MTREVTAHAWPTPVVRDAIGHYHDLLDRGFFAEVRDHHDDAHWRYDLYIDGKPLSFVFRPSFIDRETYDRAARAAELVVKGVQLATERLIADEELRGELGLSDLWKHPYYAIDLDVGAHSVLTRMDGILRPNGEVAFFEYNPAPGGLAIRWELDNLFRRTSIHGAFGRRFPFREADACHELARSLAELCLREGERRPACIARFRASPNIGPDDGFFGRWLPYLAARGTTVLSAEVEEFRLEDDGLYVGDQRVDLIIPVPLTYLFRDPQAGAPVYQAMARGLVQPMFGISRGGPSGRKSIFEVLSNERYGASFPTEVRRALRRHIPWTRVLRERRTTADGQTVDLLPHAERNRERLVLKPVSGTSGQGVVIGSDTPPSEWSALLEEAATHPGGEVTHVVQELVESTVFDYPVATEDGAMDFSPLRPDHAPFVLGDGSANSAVVRLARGRVSNAAHGASSSALWILEN